MNLLEVNIQNVRSTVIPEELVRNESTFGMFWLKDNVASMDDTICALETFIKEFNEQQRGENVIRLK